MMRNEQELMEKALLGKTIKTEKTIPGIGTEKRTLIRGIKKIGPNGDWNLRLEGENGEIALMPIMVGIALEDEKSYTDDIMLQTKEHGLIEGTITYRVVNK